MKRFKRAIAILMLSVMLIPTVINCVKVMAEITNDDINNAKDEQAIIKKRLEEAKKELDAINADKADLEAYIVKLDQQLAIISENLNTITLKIENKTAQIELTEKALEKAIADEAEQYEAMKMRIQYMYETGQTTYLEAFLASESMSDLLNRTEYVTSITEYDKKMMDKLIETKEHIAETDKKYKTELAELETLKAENEAELAAAELVHASKQEELVKLEEMADAAGQAADELMEANKQAQNKINSLIQAYKAQEDAKLKAEIEATLATKTFLGWPLPINNRTVTSKYGYRIHPIFGTKRFHSGIDLSAWSGTPIYAAADGKVIISEYSASYGEYIMVDHGGGVYTLYAHGTRNSRKVKVGDTVSKGQNIMLVGSTGYSTGPHLHYEVRVNGSTVDPLAYYNTSGITIRE